MFTPIVTSFDDDGNVAHDRMASNLEKWNQTGLSGYVVLGSNGEWVYLNEQERIEKAQLIKEKTGISGG